MRKATANAMTVDKIILPDGTTYLRTVSPENILTPIPDLPGTVTRIGSDYAEILQDFTPEDRGSQLPATNATQHDLPVDPDGFWWAVWSLLTGWRVSPNGKIIIPLGQGYWDVYWQMFIDFCGHTNAYVMLGHGNGFFDTGNFMCSPTGGDLQHIIDSILQNGTNYDIVERFDVRVKPRRVIDTAGQVHWFYGEQEVSFDLTPHLFATRTNRWLTKEQHWIMSGGVNNKSGANGGEEHWPLVANKVAAQPRWKMRRYVSLPAKLMVFPESLIVDGDLVNRQTGVMLTVDALKFRGSNTDIHDAESGLWYKGDEMLQRIPEPYAADAKDYRCYVSMSDGKTPWMGPRGYRSPVPNWQRA